MLNADSRLCKALEGQAVEAEERILQGQFAQAKARPFAMQGDER